MRALADVHAPAGVRAPSSTRALELHIHTLSRSVAGAETEMTTYNHVGARVANVDPERVSKASLSFSGCGFLCIYHAGVCAAIKEYAPQLLLNRISGASAGSIIAAGIVCNVCISQATSLFLNVVSEVSHFY